MIWFTSDSHWGHSNLLSFLDDAGNKIRPFTSVEEMDETLIQNWNANVKPGDKIYHLGDVAMGAGTLERVMPRLNGSKRLILGNHDDCRKLMPYFSKITMWRLFRDEGFVCTHVPIMADNFGKARLNLHGHIHQHVESDEQHYNISVERTQYRPVSMDEVKQVIRQRGL